MLAAGDKSQFDEGRDGDGSVCGIINRLHRTTGEKGLTEEMLTGYYAAFN